MKRCLFLLFIGLNFARAQVYAPDTTFHFHNAVFNIQAYKFTNIYATNNKFTLANVELPAKEENNVSNSPLILIDSTGKITGTFPNSTLIPNSFSENGFWFSTYDNSYYNDSAFFFHYYDFKTLQKTTHSFKKPGNYYSSIKIENGCLMLRQEPEGYQSFYIYSLEGKLLSTINTKTLYKEIFGFQKYSIEDLSVDKDQNIWLLIHKDISYTDGNLQLYKIKSGENLSSDNLVFEKTSKELGTIGVYLWGRAKFFENTIILQKINDAFKPRELVKIDFKGNLLSYTVQLPLINNDPNTNYDFFNSLNTNYITLKTENNRYHFIDNNGRLGTLDFSDRTIKSILVEGTSVYYIDNLLRLHQIDIPTLKEIESSNKIPEIRFEAGITYIQSLTNNDYWLGHKNPYNNYKTFIKFHQSKPHFKYDKEVSRVFYLGNNDLVLQAVDGEKVLIDGQNNTTILSEMDGEIMFADTLHRHFYTNIPNGGVRRYNYNQVRDSSFIWQNGILKSELVVTDNKKIYYQGARFNFDGTPDKTFQSIEIKDYFHGLTIYRLSKLWNSLSLVSGYCSEGCGGQIYQWDKDGAQPLQISNNIYQYLYKYLYLTGRGSLLVDAFDKIMPDLTIDNSFKVKARFDIRNNWITLASKQYKPIDVLPNHDLLAVLNNKIYRLSTKNSLWVEIRNLPDTLIISDSLIQTGIMLNVFSSDNSSVMLHLKPSSEKVAHLEGKKLVLDGNEGMITLVAQSIKGGQAFELSVRVQNPILQLSSIKVSPRDTSLHVDFKPFPFIYSSDIGVPLSITVEGTGVYLIDNMVYPTGKPGSVRVKVSHKATLTHYANQREVNWNIDRYSQTVKTENFNLAPSYFPFKIPISTSANLPVNYTISYGIFELITIRQDTIFLNPEFRNILREKGWYSLGTPINFTISGKQEGNNQFSSLAFSFEINLDYWEENLFAPEINVFPNLFKDYIYISGPDIQELSEVYLLDMLGRKVSYLIPDGNNYVWMGYTSSKKDKIAAYTNTKHVGNGNYLLVFNLNGKRYTYRVMK